MKPNDQVRARAFALAETVALWSTDEMKGGAVLVDERPRVVGLGWNGFHKGMEDIGESRGVIHAEANAILQCTSATPGCSMFTTTLPCLNCLAFIVKAGIKRVFIPTYAPLGEVEFEVLRHLLTQNGVEIHVEFRDRPAGV